MTSGFAAIFSNHALSIYRIHSLRRAGGIFVDTDGEGRFSCRRISTITVDDLQQISITKITANGYDYHRKDLRLVVQTS